MDQRKRLLAAVHAEAKRAGLDDDAYRDVVEAIAGKRSAASLSSQQLVAVLEAIQGRPRRATGRRQLADSGHARKIRALWLSLWNLGELTDPGEEALAAFARRQCGIDALAWVSPEDAGKVIEALKAWCQRAGVDWTAAQDPRRAVLRAQIAKLVAAGEVTPTQAEEECFRITGKGGFAFYGPTDWIKATQSLGERVRRLG